MASDDESPAEAASGIGRPPSRKPARSGRPLELRLFLHALRLAWAAQRIRGEIPLVQLVAELTSLPFLPRRVEPPLAVRGTRRACARLRRWLGALDTCLVRALVAGAMLSDRHGTVLHLGLLPPGSEGDDAAGHAWLSVSGEILDVTDDDGRRYPEIHRIEMRRSGA